MHGKKLAKTVKHLRTISLLLEEMDATATKVVEEMGQVRELHEDKMLGSLMTDLMRDVGTHAGWFMESVGLSNVKEEIDDVLDDLCGRDA